MRKVGGLALFAFGFAMQALGFQAIFGVNYFRWYAEYGSAVFLIGGVVSLALDWDRYPDCISADPYRFAAGWGQLVEDSHGALGEALRGSRGGWLTGARYLDVAIAAVFVAAWIVAVAAWMAATWFAQYALFLVCGAPARLMLAARGEGPASGYAARPVTFTAAIAAAVLYGLSQLL